MCSPRPARLPAMLAASVALSTPSISTRLVAQDSARSTPVPPNALVRVRGRDLAVGAEPVRVVEQRGDTLVLRSADGSLAFVPLDHVAGLEVAEGRLPRSVGALRGARVGALVGGVPSAVLLAVAVGYDVQHRHDPCSYICLPATPFAMLGGAVITMMTTVAGTAIGAVATPGERWTHVTPPVRVGLAPTPGGGTAVAIGFRF